MNIVDPHIEAYMASRLRRFDEPVLLEMEAEAAERNFPIVGRNVGTGTRAPSVRAASCI
jgi:predicted O-methyltransferase YrrM